MNVHLIQNVDFQWIEKYNKFGHKITVPQLKDGKILNRVFLPKINDVCLLETEEKLIPVLIKRGSYQSNNRISNFWHWNEINIDLSLSEQKSGYGYFYEAHMKFRI